MSIPDRGSQDDWVLVFVSDARISDAPDDEDTFVCVSNTLLSRLRSEVVHRPRRAYLLFSISIFTLLCVEWSGTCLWVSQLSSSQIMFLTFPPLFVFVALVRWWGLLPASTFVAGAALAVCSVVPSYSAILLISLTEKRVDDDCETLGRRIGVSITVTIIVVLELADVTASFFHEELVPSSGARLLADLFTSIYAVASCALLFAAWVWLSLLLHYYTAAILRSRYLSSASGLVVSNQQVVPTRCSPRSGSPVFESLWLQHQPNAKGERPADSIPPTQKPMINIYF